MPDTTLSDTGETHWRVQVVSLLFLTLIFFLNFISRIIPAPLLPVIERDMGLGHGEAGALFLLISLGYFSTLSGSGFVSSRLTHRRTIIVSCASLGAALLAVALSSSPWAVALGLLGLGMAAGLYLPSGIAAITSLVGPRHWGKALATHELAPNLSFVLAPLTAEVFLRWMPWRGVVALVGACALLACAAFARYGRGGDFAGEAPGFSSVRALAAIPSFWIMIVLFSLGISSTLGIYSMLPLYLVTERGLDQGWANTLVALSRVSTLGTAFLAGWITDWMGPRRTMAGVFAVTGVLTVLLGVAADSWLVLVIFLQPTLAVCFFPAGFAALSLISPPESRSLAVSLAVPLGFLTGAGVVPIGIGMMADAGSFALSFCLVGAVIAGGSSLSLLLKIPGAHTVSQARG